MKTPLLFAFETDHVNHRIQVKRAFEAPVDLVWAAWTEADLLEQWFAPKPWKAVTKTMDFREGGHWLYCMEGPAGERHWSIFKYHHIKPLQFYSGHDAFCDENGVVNESLPSMQWENSFTPQQQNTVVEVTIQLKSLKDLEGILKMGFKEGFTMGLQNLDAYIAAQFYLRRQKNTSRQPRVSTYVNMAGNTEEAFQFYKKVFKTDFIQGIQRFADLPANPNQPPLADAVKNMVLHVELPLLGNHVLMGTDAPEQMGFTLSKGNNMHINLEPHSRAEATRIFEELSAGGLITMPLQDMFWGAYYGSFTDRYGINWMVNYQGD
ncbi:MAG TPA: SRPBCC domain-containing protein [Phnomibacter sp.]|nr:SRPBCC domain-containing protein [Phnomibacter sp.]